LRVSPRRSRSSRTRLPNVERNWASAADSSSAHGDTGAFAGESALADKFVTVPCTFAEIENRGTILPFVNFVKQYIAFDGSEFDFYSKKRNYNAS